MALIPRTYRITKVQDKKLKQAAKKAGKKEAEFMRSLIDSI